MKKHLYNLKATWTSYKCRTGRHHLIDALFWRYLNGDYPKETNNIED